MNDRQAVHIVPSEPRLDVVPTVLRASTDAWQRRHRRHVILADHLTTLSVVTVAAVTMLRSGSTAAVAPGWNAAALVLSAVITAACVLGALFVSHAWDPRGLGHGAEEYRRVGRALLSTMVFLALIGFAWQLTVLRPWIFVVVPLIGLTALPVRYVIRQALHRRRRAGQCLLPVLAAGGVETLRELIARTRREPHSGWRIDGVCITRDSWSGLMAWERGEIDGVPVVGTIDELAELVGAGGYRVVALAPDPYWTPGRIQRLAWQLEGSDAEMVVAPMLLEVTGPRLNVAPVFGLPLLWVSQPTFTGVKRVVKDCVDRIVAVLLLLLAAPLFLVIAVLIRIDSGGPILYRQRRVGREGRIFTMIKFRSMVQGAHRLRAGMDPGDDQGAGPMFKMRRDPRITKVGAVLRRYSIDELPQLFNVVTGSMSLVGPRPPLPEEVEHYDPAARRRLLVKPGLTGLWQVSGRSDLSWEESVRLDLRYVENWSLALDFVILWKTVWAVVRGQGAY
ncbi:sugar transferase [Actinoalloteichus hymeniacidonis]|uniref:Exopolysaccharide biosynthesis polyprenyl glycosylphosphotransferase n=1 Tax=Actinoalloteichus hymeniacidonis TaxID=340345 RepID=A0AAC9N1I7_9PSEU|nr:sugar transferase [Actinoalloteichus hymeniacidonis]AOS65911.1 exopolysaccharide biosynthesis polyprenyl glycosylphosphotransferase [Actinoalloteichus hymeniacidonis]MBB5905993.1 exopolysaccharide biosynthesis polyprenyl glycosylphosphotransferase [Actinoalloteichus hymeniacidonis]